VSDIVIQDEDMLDEDTTIVPSKSAQQETPNTFGRYILQRLGIAHGHTRPKAAGSQSSPNTKFVYLLGYKVIIGWSNSNLLNKFWGDLSTNHQLVDAIN